MSRLFTLVLSLLTMVTACFAEPSHFVALSWVTPDKQAQYEGLIKAVAPIWKRHGLTVLTRSRTIDVLGGDPNWAIPSEVTLLRVESMAGFQAYLDDPEYKKIRKTRLDAVDAMIVLEGQARGEDRSQFIASAPLTAFLFDGETGDDSPPHLQLSMTASGSIKGAVDTLFDGVKTVRIVALSFDDDPTRFSASGDRPALITIGESIRLANQP